MQTEQFNFDPKEIERIKKSLSRSYKERFEIATQLYKTQKMIENKLIITHKPSLDKQ